MTHQTASEVSELIKLQVIIRRKYPDLVGEYTFKYCVNCLSYPACVLIPVTSTGDKCPYFEKAINASSQR